LRAASIKGEAHYPTFGYRVKDRVQAYGFSVARSFYKDAKLNAGVGVAVDYLNAVRQVSGDPLSWGRSYRATGFGVGIVGRASYSLGEVTSVIITVEPSYWSYTKFTQEEQLVGLGRPLASAPGVTIGIGLIFTIGA